MLNQPQKFFAVIRQLFSPKLSTSEVEGCNAVLKAMEGTPLTWTAYALATAFHETASTMQPISERGGPVYFARMYDVMGARKALAIAEGNTMPGDGARYCGRGYVQLTWKNNYSKASEECGVDLVGHPELALDTNVAAKILRTGMEQGWFTGKKFSDYLPATTSATSGQYSRARWIINGQDKAVLIAGIAKQFESALREGDWK